MAAGYDGSIRIDTRLNTKGFNAGTKQIENGLTNITASLKKLAGAVGLAFGVKAIIDFSRTSVKAATDMTNAMMGLQSIMEGQGRSFARAQQFINDYVNDGLIPATQAITAYKNLALRGYDDSQIQQVLIALKDSAAFGRQANYSLGEAVETATEGLKNENSILVDNAGVTKNVAKMWDEYAKSIGTTASSLTQQQKIQAEVNGILEESKYQVGDAAKVANSYSGEILRLGFSFNNLRIAVGNALIPLAQAVLPSINAIITALTRLANVFAQVTTAIFGKQAKAQEQIAKTATAGAKAENNLDKATKQAGNATEKAGKQAKGALAGFDELNILAENTAEGMASAADDIEDTSFGGIDAGAGLGGELGSDITVSPAVQAAVDTFMRLLEPLKSINFGNLKTAFNNLKVAIEPITKALFAGLEWAYLNIFVPLAEWTIEDVLPAFLDLLSGAIKVLSSVIDALKPLAEWLWKNFLKPIAEWTGGLIVSLLEALAGALEGISEWISDNQGLVRGMAITVGLFFAAWEVSTLLVFMTNAGGVIGILKKLTDTIKACTTAKIASRIEDLKIVALYAKEFIVSFAKATVEIAKNTAAWIASTAAKVAGATAQTAMNIAVGIWNGLAAIATSLTTAFGAAVAFLTSPIGLVILAIAALIAIVVLLVKHWDEVKAMAIAVWNAIVATWKVAATWFNTNVVQPIAHYFTGLWEGVKSTFTLAWDFMTSAFKGYINNWIGFVEGFINFFINAINLLIAGLNKISFDIPSWVPGVGGKSFGINIPIVPKVQIPRLATGAVIPPNSEFLAILGDQRSGRNLEAPEDLIRQIVQEEAGSAMLAVMQLIQGNTSNQGGDIVIQVDGVTLARIINPYLARENQRIGPAIIKPI